MALDLRYSTVVLSQFRRVHSPANRPKWNAVSKKNSVNSVYNPEISHMNTIRRIWNIDLQRKRVHRLPPMKRKTELDEPSSSTFQHDQIETNTTPSRHSSKGLVPMPRLPDFPLLSETPRSQRPIQQEWYDERSRTHLTYRTRQNSLQDLNAPIRQSNTPREPLTLRSSTRVSENSTNNNSLLDASIRTNRATELRLSKDMDEHHQHSHSPYETVPTEIRGFRLEGAPLSVPDNTTIRPLSNVNYRSSEQVKTRRNYPWSNLHPQGPMSRNNSLVPINEFGYPSYDTSINEDPQTIPE